MKINTKGALVMLAFTAMLGLTACSSTNTGSSSSDSPKVALTKSNKTNKFINKDNSILVSKDGAVKSSKDIKDKGVLDIYLDPLCPGCGDFEREFGEYLNEKMNDGLIIRYHPLMFLDKSSSDNYSSRGSAYVYGVAEEAPELTGKFISGLFRADFQPGEGVDYKSKTTKDLDKMFKSIGGTDEQVKKINEKLEQNELRSYELTLEVMKSQDLSSKSPTGALFTPFIIPNEAGKTGDKALMFDDNISSSLKSAVEKIMNSK